MNTAKYCSLTCKGLFEREKIKTICGVCKKEFFHTSCRANKAKYCSRKCYHRSQIERGNTTFKCLHCGRDFNDSLSAKRKYCRRKCINKSEMETFSPKYSTVRKAMLRRNMIESCVKCGYKEVKEVLGVHHKDGNRNNNKAENLMVVCPLCHSLIHNKHISH